MQKIYMDAWKCHIYFDLFLVLNMISHDAKKSGISVHAYIIRYLFDAYWHIEAGLLLFQSNLRESNETS